MAQSKRDNFLTIFIIILGGLVPIILYWGILGQVPTMTAGEAIHLLNQNNSGAILIDVRTEDEFNQEHVEGAKTWPLEHISAIQSPTEIPEAYRNQTLIFICDAGTMGARATQLMNSIGLADVYNVRGGMQEWAKSGAENPKLNYSHFVSPGKEPYLSIQEMSIFDQTMQVFSGFVVKPLYMLISLFLFFILRRLKSPDMVALRWSLLIFFVGEAFCAINYLVFQDNSLHMEYLHSMGMAVAFGFAAYAILEGLDSRVLRMSPSGKTCAAIGLCGPCSKYGDVDCKGQKVYQSILVAFAIVALLPLTIDPSLSSYSSQIFGTIYHYTELAVFQFLEARYLPIITLLLLVVAFGWMAYRSEKTIPSTSRILFSAGLGALGFGLFRIVLVFTFEDQLMWAGFWEESTELLAVLFISAVLWTFRRQLFDEIKTMKRQPGIS